MPVVDASVLVGAVADATAVGRWAEDILAAGDIIAPHLVLAEAASALRRLESTSVVGRLEATAAHTDLTRLDMLLVPYDPFAERIWQLRNNLSCYDAWYVALAEMSGLPLATMDHRLARSPGPECEFLLPPGKRAPA